MVLDRRRYTGSTQHLQRVLVLESSSTCSDTARAYTFCGMGIVCRRLTEEIDRRTQYNRTILPGKAPSPVRTHFMIQVLFSGRVMNASKQTLCVSVLQL